MKYIGGSRCPSGPSWRRGMSRLSFDWLNLDHSDATPALVGHKEPARHIQSHQYISYFIAMAGRTKAVKS
jgi:hypothetical protein